MRSPVFTRRRLIEGLVCLAGVGLLAGCGIALDGRRSAKVHRVGFLSGGASALSAASVKAFRLGLRELGYVEGRDFSLELRFAEGQVERSPDLAVELVRLPVDVIVAAGTVPARAAREATDTIPIVLVRADDAVRFGLVASLARPGGNVTSQRTEARPVWRRNVGCP